MMTLMQSTLTQERVRPNRRKQKKKNVLKDFRPLYRPERSGTDGQNPTFGMKKNAGPIGKIKLPAITPWKVILASFLIGICGLLYINHLFGTQQTLQEVQQLEAEYNRIQRIHNQKRLEFDRMIGPKEIYQQARSQGFINAGPADQIVTLK
ncbi:MAG: hypothetical protein WD355_05625 [Balneolaceae bacterium]